jgi:SAM-dependent methyltransferase
MPENDYVKNIYNTTDKPFSNYPQKLVKHLVDSNKISKGSKILEIGCGRGDFINEFINLEMVGYGIDASKASKDFFSGIKFSQVDLLKEKIPHEDNLFDVIYSKSVIEHFYYPEKIMEEAYRVLKPGGLIITLTPDWEFIYRSFYEDFTHRTPFTSISLRDIHLISNFKNVEVIKFKQLPILWDKSKFNYIFFYFLSFLTRVILPEKLRMKNKWIRFSKEIMLLSTANK